MDVVWFRGSELDKYWNIEIMIKIKIVLILFVNLSWVLGLYFNKIIRWYKFVEVGFLLI